MVEYVYALHDFVPENDDEIAFQAGERIVVVEKDEQYGDGWWQGINLQGRTGLFPRAYTAPAPAPTVRTPESRLPGASAPLAGTPLLPLREESLDTADGAVMAATMTDVQEAIEQLGVRNDADRRSFSFVSTRDGDVSDSEVTVDAEVDSGNYHRDARNAILERLGPLPDTRQLTPPIQAEMSDESEDEDEAGIHNHLADRINSLASPILLSVPENAISSEEPDELVLPDRSQDPYSARASSDSPKSIIASQPSREQAGPSAQVEVSPTKPTATPSQLHSHPKPQTPTTATGFSFIRSSSPLRSSAVNAAAYFTPVPVPTYTPPAPTTPTVSMPPVTPPDVDQTKTKSAQDWPAIPTAPVPPVHNQVTSALPIREPSKPTRTSEWTVEQVVDWVQSKGFDESVWSKFREHEITGDILLEFDANMLKEIDIHAFGKRMKIANAIAELRRPASLVSSQSSTGNNGQNGRYPPNHLGQWPLNSPAQFSRGSSPGERLFSPESPMQPGDIVGSPGPMLTRFDRRESDPGQRPSDEITSHPSVGLGIGDANGTNPLSSTSRINKNRPPSLVLQVPEGIVHGKHSPIPQDDDEQVNDDRQVLSEGEATATRTKRRKGQGRSSGSMSSQPTSDFLSSTAASSIPPSPGVKKSTFEGTSPTSPNPRPKKSGEASHSTRDRLSFFGGTIGKSRKPPPREHSDTSPTEKASRNSRFSLHKRPGVVATSPSTAMVQKDGGLLRKRGSDSGHRPGATLKAGENIVDQIGEPDYSGWMRKRGERYNTWKLRYFVLQGPHLYYLRSREETKLKGYINIAGYKIFADEATNPGRYGFRIVHDTEKPHFFSSDEQLVVREWMKALMKATIDRDYTKPVVSSCNIPTIPLTVAQAMNPAPRPPSPGARDATQKALRRENPNQLSSRDARVLMGLPSPPKDETDDRKRLESFETYASHPQGSNSSHHSSRKPSVSDRPAKQASTPIRPTRESRKPARHRALSSTDAGLLMWMNSNLPDTIPQATDLSSSLSSGLLLFRLAESIKYGKNKTPPTTVPDSVFPGGPDDDQLDGYLKLFDFLVEHDIKVGCSINDVRTGKQEKIVQLIRALKTWKDKREALTRAVGVQALSSGTFMVSV